MSPFRGAAAVAVALLLWPGQAHAQAPAAAPSGQPAGTQPASPPFTAGWQDGFVVQSANGDYRLLFGLVAQIDGRFSLDDPTPIIDTFTSARRGRRHRPRRRGISTSR